MRIFLRKYGSLLGGICLLVAGAIVISLISNRIFSLETIEVVGQDMQIDIDKEKLSKNVLFFPSRAIEEQLLRQYPVLSSVRISKKFPHTVVIALSTRQPIAELLTPTGRFWVSVGAYHTGEPTVHTRKFPIIKADVVIVPLGRPVRDVRIISAIALLQGLAQTVVVDEIQIRDESTLRAMSASTEILFRQSSDMQDQIVILKGLVSGFRVKGTTPKQIDLRFNKPVIVF